MRKTLIGVILTIVLCCSAAGADHEAAEDVAKYRQSIMKALSGHNGAIRLIVAGKAGDPDRLADHIAAIAGLAAEVNAVFPAGSNLEDDESLPAIWEDAEGFAEAVARFEEAAGALHGMADGDVQDIDAAHREMGKACKGCHEEFRVDD